MQMDNKINRVRPNITFQNYIAETSSQKEAAEVMSDLSNTIIGLKDNILQHNNPFPRANFIFLSGKPGVGKTHLQEAFVNTIKLEAPELVNANKIVYMRQNFTHAFMTFAMEHDFNKNPIIVVDDLFAEDESLKGLHPRTAGAAITNFMSEAYNNNNLVIFSSNFNLENDLASLIKQNDPQGRLQSRLQEAAAINLHIEGNDYRAVKSKKGLFLGM